MDYHSLNAMLNLYGPNGEIQFDKDREAAREYFLQHVNQNTVFFHSLREKLDYLVEEGYYEQEVLDQYDFDFVKSLFKRAYAVRFRFPTFMGAFKYYTSYTLKTFDAVTGRLGLKSRADALRRVCRVPSAFLEPDPDLADALRDVARELSAIGRNVNQLVATKNYEVRRGEKLKLTKPQQQVLSDLLDHIDRVSTQVREMEGKRASETVRRFVAGMKGAGDGAD